jgi:hypothetical protein
MTGRGFAVGLERRRFPGLDPLGRLTAGLVANRGDLLAASALVSVAAPGLLARAPEERLLRASLLRSCPHPYRPRRCKRRDLLATRSTCIFLVVTSDRQRAGLRHRVSRALTAHSVVIHACRRRDDDSTVAFDGCGGVWAHSALPALDDQAVTLKQLPGWSLSQHSAAACNNRI